MKVDFDLTLKREERYVAVYVQVTIRAGWPLCKPELII